MLIFFLSFFDDDMHQSVVDRDVKFCMEVLKTQNHNSGWIAV